MIIKYILAAITLLSFICPYSLSAQKEIITPAINKSSDVVKVKSWVDSVYNKMTRDQRIGQLFMPVIAGDITESNKKNMLDLVKNQHIGGILFSKGSPVNQANLTNIAQKAAKTPLMISLDGEWGLAMRLSNTTRFPYNMTLGAVQNDSLLYYYGLEVARQCKLMGIQVNFAPVLDANSNPANPVIGYRSFGEDPESVARKGIMYAKGLEAGGVMAVAKHFPGHGDTSDDSHKTLPTINHDRGRLDSVELNPFKQYIEAGLSGMMVGHLNIPALEEKTQPSSLSESITTNLLQRELGFSGLIFTDGLQMQGVSGEYNYCVRALLAGNDILLGPVSPIKEFEAVRKAVADSVISDSLIELKCKKVLTYKYLLGLNNTKTIETKNLVNNINSSHANWLNRELYKNAITLLKDSQKIIPLKELGQRKIAAVSVGGGSNNTFHKSLKLYGDVTCFNVSDSDGLNKLKSRLASFNTIIFSVHNTKSNVNTAIQNVSKGKETIITFFVVPYRMSSYESSVKSADGAILAYENTELAQDYAAQTIFGGNAASGRIPVTIKNLFQKGEGENTDRVRLSYGVPEDVGIESSRLNNIENIITEGIKAEAFPGGQLLIAKDGVVIYNRSFGSFGYDGKRKVTNEDIYDLASMTKASATLPALMKLYDESKINLNSPLSAYIPALKGSDKSRITVREALFHETGLRSFIPYYMNAIDKSSYEGKLFNRRRSALYSAQFDETTWARNDYKFKPDMVSIVSKSNFLPLADKMYINKAYKDTIISAIVQSKLRPRKTYLYSCLNFMLLKEAVEKITRVGLDEYVQSNFFKGLGAVTTTYNPLKRFEKDIIVPTEKDDFLRKQLIQGYVHDEGAAFMGGVSGNAGLFSNANDLAKLYQMWLNGGVYGGERYLSERTCRLFTKTKSSTSRRGLGFDKPETRTNKSGPTSFSTPASTYGHTGFTGTCFWIDPDNNLIYIFLSNRVYAKRTHKKLMTMSIRQRVQEEIYKAMKKAKTKDDETTITTNTEEDDEQTDTE